MEHRILQPLSGWAELELHLGGEGGAAGDAHALRSDHPPVAAHEDVDGVPVLGTVPSKSVRPKSRGAGQRCGRAGEYRRPGALLPGERPGVVDEDAGVHSRQLASADHAPQIVLRGAGGQGLASADHTRLPSREAVQLGEVHAPRLFGILRRHKACGTGLWMTAWRRIPVTR